MGQMGGWSFLISPQIGCSIISKVIKISWGWHGQGKRILMLDHLFLFEAAYHTNDGIGPQCCSVRLWAVSQWVAGIILSCIWGSEPINLPEYFCVHEAGVLGTLVGSPINGMMVNSHYCCSDPSMMLDICSLCPQQQCLWMVYYLFSSIAFTILPFSINQRICP